MDSADEGDSFYDAASRADVDEQWAEWQLPAPGEGAARRRVLDQSSATAHHRPSRLPSVSSESTEGISLAGENHDPSLPGFRRHHHHQQQQYQHHHHHHHNHNHNLDHHNHHHAKNLDNRSEARAEDAQGDEEEQEEEEHDVNPPQPSESLVDSFAQAPFDHHLAAGVGIDEAANADGGRQHIIHSPRAQVQRGRRASALSGSALPFHAQVAGRRGSLSAVERTAAATPPAGKMNRSNQPNNEDLFLALANDEIASRPPSSHMRAPSRLSIAAKRHSLPHVGNDLVFHDRRPGTSGHQHEHRPASRAEPARADSTDEDDMLPNTPGAFPMHEEPRLLRSTAQPLPKRAQTIMDGTDRVHSPSPRWNDRVRSPELTQARRRRLSALETLSEAPRAQHGPVSARLRDMQIMSPADSFGAKQSLPDSASVDSQTNDSTVWDELDDLKSRIKKLELTGKPPGTAGQVVSGESAERPRTATTAPTTIDSSPKQQKPSEKKAEQPQTPSIDRPGSAAGVVQANIHPLLHSALAKAKPLLNATLYRQLEATVNDALQLAAMTGSAGPQGTAFTAASIMHGVTIPDRQVRRKADAMCRNLTDLTLALCEGKHETAATGVPSPMDITPINKSSPSLRVRESLSGRYSSLGRPMSRLEERRSSILGPQANTAVGASTSFESGEDVSASEQESTTPSHLRVPDPRQSGGRSNSRLHTARMPRYDDVSGDEDPTIRPLSRARTDAGSSAGHFSHSSHAHRSPSLREALAIRRAHNNPETPSNNHSLSRISSLTSSDSRRRYLRDVSATPPVIEEQLVASPEDDSSNPGAYSPSPQYTSQQQQQQQQQHQSMLKRRINSVGHRSSRLSYSNVEPPGGGHDRTTTRDPTGRATSLGQNRRLFVS